MDFYEQYVLTPTGEQVSMQNYAGKVVLVVNTATGCGFTPQYADLERLYEKYHDKGLEIVDVPCNQFFGQAPGSDDEIHQFCALRYHTQFPQFKKSDVNGANALPLFSYLKSQKGFEGFGDAEDSAEFAAFIRQQDENFERNSDIKWNFTKFLINRKGNVVARFEPIADMSKVEKMIAENI
ncbi:MAG: glutathione peroxidase [Alphaproteobacteria bacterium]|nr:glutathione peroxidase [Alphaproteobacteria bacterium]